MSTSPSASRSALQCHLRCSLQHANIAHAPGRFLSLAGEQEIVCPLLGHSAVSATTPATSKTPEQFADGWDEVT
jgi:hypothetical protein